MDHSADNDCKKTQFSQHQYEFLCCSVRRAQSCSSGHGEICGRVSVVQRGRPLRATSRFSDFLGFALSRACPRLARMAGLRRRPEDLEFIRERTRTGQPCASDEFARMLEARVGRPLLRRKPGPKKKEAVREATTPSLFENSSGFE
jgi:hypothetical protein